MKWVVTVAAVFCVLLIGGGVYFATREQVAPPRVLPLDPAYTARESQGYWSEGATEPAVIVDEYSDFQCPYCGQLYPLMEQAISQSSDYVQLRYHQYPLYGSHNKARLASQAAEAAGRQGKFWEMYRLLFSSQGNWSEQTTFAFQGTAEGYAQQLGLNLEQFKNDMKDRTLQARIDRDVADGNAIPVTGTPTLVVNGKKLANIPQRVEDLLSLFEQAKAAGQ